METIDQAAANAESADAYFAERHRNLDTLHGRTIYARAFAAGANWRAGLAQPAVPEKMTQERAADFVMDCSPVDGFLRFTQGWNMCREAVLAAPPQAPESAESADTSVGEVAAFEQLAKKHDWSMEQHPLHYLFLDDVTAAARAAWREGISFIQARMDAELGALRWELTESQRKLQAMRAYRDGELSGTATHYWLGDGEDHLESLCTGVPVVIEAQTLRELIGKPGKPAAPNYQALYEHEKRCGDGLRELVRELQAKSAEPAGVVEPPPEGSDCNTAGLYAAGLSLPIGTELFAASQQPVPANALDQLQVMALAEEVGARRMLQALLNHFRQCQDAASENGHHEHAAELDQLYDALKEHGEAQFPQPTPTTH